MAWAGQDELGERTEPPSSQRLAEARRGGQVPHSGELTSAAVVLGALLLAGLLGRGLLGAMTTMTAELLDGRTTPADVGELASLAARAAWPAVGLTAAILAGAAGAAALTGVAQVGPLAASEQVRPQWQRVSLREGLRRLFSGRTLVRAAFAAAKVSLVAAVGYATVRPQFPRLVAAAGLSAGELAAEAGNLAAGLAVRIALCLLALGLADLLFQRWQHRRDLRMTRWQRLEAQRRTEGDSDLRRRRRQLARRAHRRARAQPLAAERSAGLIIGRPERGTMGVRVEELPSGHA